MGRIFVRLLLGGITGKVLGLVREMLLAALFGAGRVVAANRVALTATMIPIQFFTSDALSAGFLPLYVRYRQDNPGMALVLYRSVRRLLLAFSLTLVAALLLGRHAWVRFLAPGLDADTSAIAATMLSIAALGVPFYIAFSLDSLVALAHDDVRPINLRASFQSIGLIGATVAAYLTGDVELLAWGFSAPYAVLCCWAAYWVRRRGYLRSIPDATPPDRSAHRLAMAMFWRRLRPLLLIPVILQGSIAVERIVGSLLGVEVVAATEYARFVVDSCMALLAAPLGLAGLASFAKMAPDRIADGLRRLVPPILLATVPISVVLALNSTGIVSLLYGRGQFDDRAVAVSSVMLLGFALGIWAHVLGHTFVKVLNARGANVRVAVVMAVTFSSAMAVNLLMYRHWGAITLGVSSSVGGLIMLVASSYCLGILRYVGGLLALLVPGAALSVAAGWLLSGGGLMRLIGSSLAVAVVWLLYVAAVPRLRRVLVSLARTGRARPVG